MVIREMQAQDVEAVTALEAACFTQPWRRHDFEDILTNPDRFYFVAVEDNEVMGGCMLTDIVGEGDVSNVAVHEKYRRRGIAMPCWNICFNLAGSGESGTLRWKYASRMWQHRDYMKDWALFQKVYDPISMTNLRITQ